MSFGSLSVTAVFRPTALWDGGQLVLWPFCVGEDSGSSQQERHFPIGQSPPANGVVAGSGNGPRFRCSSTTDHRIVKI